MDGSIDIKCSQFTRFNQHRIPVPLTDEEKAARAAAEAEAQQELSQGIKAASNSKDDVT